MKKRICPICRIEVGTFQILRYVRFDEGSTVACSYCMSYYDPKTHHSREDLRKEIYKSAPQNLSPELRAETKKAIEADVQRWKDSLPKLAGEYEDFIFSPEGISNKYLKHIKDSKLRMELTPMDIDLEAVAVLCDPIEDYGLDVTLGYLFKGELKAAALSALRGEHKSYDLEPIGVSGGDDAKKVLKVRLSLWD